MVCRFGRSTVYVQVWLNGQGMRGWKLDYVLCVQQGDSWLVSLSCQKWAYKAITYNNYAFVKCNQWFTIRLSKFRSIASSSKMFRSLIIPFEMRHFNSNCFSLKLLSFLVKPPTQKVLTQHKQWPRTIWFSIRLSYLLLATCSLFYTKINRKNVVKLNLHVANEMTSRVNSARQERKAEKKILAKKVSVKKPLIKYGV